MKLISRFLSIFFLALLAAVTGCDSVGDGALTDLPRVDINCTSSKCTSAGVGAYDVRVDFTLSGCANSINISVFNLVARGVATVVCDGTRCTGSVISWVDTNNNAITEIISRTYDVCGWIDLDNSGFPINTSDAVSENELSVNSSVTLELTDWSASP